jgi:hypothetical protein
VLSAPAWCTRMSHGGSARLLCLGLVARKAMGQYLLDPHVVPIAASGCRPADSHRFFSLLAPLTRCTTHERGWSGGSRGRRSCSAPLSKAGGGAKTKGEDEGRRCSKRRGVSLPGMPSCRPQRCLAGDGAGPTHAVHDWSRASSRCSAQAGCRALGMKAKPKTFSQGLESASCM